MLDAGFKDVHQLQGGILGYFAEVGGDHWDGECFVFDKRVALGPDLKETDTVVCFACLEPLSREQQQSQHYIPNLSCHYCAESS
jgi:predicted sulfurtransferase